MVVLVLLNVVVVYEKQSSNYKQQFTDIRLYEVLLLIFFLCFQQYNKVITTINVIMNGIIMIIIIIIKCSFTFKFCHEINANKTRQSEN